VEPVGVVKVVTELRQALQVLLELLIQAVVVGAGLLCLRRSLLAQQAAPVLSFSNTQSLFLQ
jgi:hypothetical protein